MQFEKMVTGINWEALAVILIGIAQIALGIALTIFSTGALASFG